MYESNVGGGAITAVSGGLLLPNTGGNTPLTIVAYTSIAAGVAIVVSTLVRAAAAKAYKA
jgi:hypothetical protein